MSAHAASIPNKKSSKRKKSSKNGSNPRSRSNSISQQPSSVTGFYIRDRTFKTFLWCLEMYVTFLCSSLLLLYLITKNLFWRSSSKMRNPFRQSSSSFRTIIGKSGSSNDVSEIPLDDDTTDSAMKLKPRCLADPKLGIHKFIKIQGVNLHYTESGYNRSNPPILLLHGALDFWFTWRYLVPTLSKRFRVFCLDMRGSGDSEKPWMTSKYSLDILIEDVSAFIKAVGDPSHERTSGMILMGTGWGGQVCWSVAEKYPALVPKMILIHSPHPHVIRSHFMLSMMNCCKFWWLFVARLPFFAEWSMEEGHLNVISKTLTDLNDKKAISADEVNAYFYNFCRTEDLRGSVNHIRNWKMWHSSYFQPQPRVLCTPTLLLMGDSDPHLPTETGYRSAEYVERIKTRVLTGGSNWSHITNAEDILVETAGFLNEPRLLERTTSQSSDEDWDSYNQPQDDRTESIVGRMMGTVMSPLNSLHHGSSRLFSNFN